MQLTAPLTRCQRHKRSAFAKRRATADKQWHWHRPLPQSWRGEPDRTVILPRPTGGEAGPVLFRDRVRGSPMSQQYRSGLERQIKRRMGGARSVAPTAESATTKRGPPR